VRGFLKHLSRPIALLVVAAQLLLALPAVADMPAPSPAGTHAPCDEMPAGNHEDGCPCCPDGSGSMRGCLAMCTIAAAISPSVFAVGVAPSPWLPFADLPERPTLLSDPPLNPPPIA
jgi:hypothetical protein